MFRRQIEILKDNQNKLAQKTVLVIGAGGLGNVVLSQIGSIGLKHIHIIDFDKIELHNIHRQYYFTQDDIGSYKAQVLANKANRCDTNITFSTKQFKEDLDFKADLIIDCCDNFETRKQIDIFAKNTNTPWLYGSVESWVGQVCLFENKKFDIFNVSNAHKVLGVMPSMVGVVGGIQSVIATKYLSELDVQSDKLYYIDFSSSLELNGFGI